MFYTYLWLREDGTPYYVGKGCRDRAWLDCIGHHPPKDGDYIILQEFESEQDSITAEIFLISYYGRKDLGTGTLRNLTDGGDGVSGYKHTEETKAILGRMSKGHKELPEVTTKRIAKLRGLKRNPETCARLKEVAEQRTYTTETRSKFRAAKLGTTQSDETRAKMSEAHKLHYAAMPEEKKATRGQKIRAAKLGVPRSPETISKMTGWHHTSESRIKMKATKAIKRMAAVAGR